MLKKVDIVGKFKNSHSEEKRFTQQKLGEQTLFHNNFAILASKF